MFRFIGIKPNLFGWNCFSWPVSIPVSTINFLYVVQWLRGLVFPLFLVTSWAIQVIHPNSPIKYVLAPRPSLEQEVVLVRHLTGHPKAFISAPRIDEQGGTSEASSARIHKSSLYQNILLVDMPSYWIAFNDCILQLIELICYITTSLEVHIRVKTYHRLNLSVSLPRVIFYLFPHSPSTLQ